MAKKYTRKQVSSLSELDLEQERIKYKAKRIEDDMLDVFSPQQIAMTMVSYLLRRRKKKADARPVMAATGRKEKKQEGKIAGAVSDVVKSPLLKKAARKVGISFLRWQAFNLALFLGKKIVRSIQEKRRERKLHHV